MKVLVPVLLLLSLLALRAACQAQPHRGGATVLRDGCPSAADVASQTTDIEMSTVLSNVAALINNGTRTRTCLRKIYVMAYTSGILHAETTHAHLIEVVGAGQTRKIPLPERPNDIYSRHKGDIWKIDIFSDFRFLPGTCLRPCNILNITITEGGNNGWNIDSIVTYGCTNDFGCRPLTQDIDVNRWVDGDRLEGYLRFPLSKVSQNLCL